MAGNDDNIGNYGGDVSKGRESYDPKAFEETLGVGALNVNQLTEYMVDKGHDPTEHGLPSQDESNLISEEPKEPITKLYDLHGLTEISNPEEQNNSLTEAIVNAKEMIKKEDFQDSDFAEQCTPVASVEYKERATGQPSITEPSSRLGGNTLDYGSQVPKLEEDEGDDLSPEDIKDFLIDDKDKEPRKHIKTERQISFTPEQREEMDKLIKTHKNKNPAEEPERVNTDENFPVVESETVSSSYANNTPGLDHDHIDSEGNEMTPNPYEVTTDSSDEDKILNELNDPEFDLDVEGALGGLQDAPGTYEESSVSELEQSMETLESLDRFHSYDELRIVVPENNEDNRETIVTDPIEFKYDFYSLLSEEIKKVFESTISQSENTANDKISKEDKNLSELLTENERIYEEKEEKLRQELKEQLDYDRIQEFVGDMNSWLESLYEKNILEKKVDKDHPFISKIKLILKQTKHFTNFEEDLYKSEFDNLTTEKENEDKELRKSNVKEIGQITKDKDEEVKNLNKELESTLSKYSQHQKNIESLTNGEELNKIYQMYEGLDQNLSQLNGNIKNLAELATKYNKRELSELLLNHSDFKLKEQEVIEILKNIYGAQKINDKISLDLLKNKLEGISINNEDISKTYYNKDALSSYKNSIKEVDVILNLINGANEVNLFSLRNYEIDSEDIDLTIDFFEDVKSNFKAESTNVYNLLVEVHDFNEQFKDMQNALDFFETKYVSEIEYLKELKSNELENFNLLDNKNIKSEYGLLINKLETLVEIKKKSSVLFSELLTHPIYESILPENKVAEETVSYSEEFHDLTGDAEELEMDFDDDGEINLSEDNGTNNPQIYETYKSKISEIKTEIDELISAKRKGYDGEIKDHEVGFEDFELSILEGNQILKNFENSLSEDNPEVNSLIKISQEVRESYDSGLENKQEDANASIRVLESQRETEVANLETRKINDTKKLKEDQEKLNLVLTSMRTELDQSYEVVAENLFDLFEQLSKEKTLADKSCINTKLSDLIKIHKEVNRLHFEDVRSLKSINSSSLEVDGNNLLNESALDKLLDIELNSVYVDSEMYSKDSVSSYFDSIEKFDYAIRIIENYFSDSDESDKAVSTLNKMIEIYNHKDKQVYQLLTRTNSKNKKYLGCLVNQLLDIGNQLDSSSDDARENHLIEYSCVLDNYSKGIVNQAEMIGNVLEHPIYSFEGLTESSEVSKSTPPPIPVHE